MVLDLQSKDDFTPHDVTQQCNGVLDDSTRKVTGFSLSAGPNRSHTWRVCGRNGRAGARNEWIYVWLAVDVADCKRMPCSYVHVHRAFIYRIEHKT